MHEKILQAQTREKLYRLVEEIEQHHIVMESCASVTMTTLAGVYEAIVFMLSDSASMRSSRKYAKTVSLMRKKVERCMASTSGVLDMAKIRSELSEEEGD